MKNHKQIKLTCWELRYDFLHYSGIQIFLNQYEKIHVIYWEIQNV